MLTVNGCMIIIMMSTNLKIYDCKMFLVFIGQIFFLVVQVKFVVSLALGQVSYKKELIDSWFVLSCDEKSKEKIYHTQKN